MQTDAWLDFLNRHPEAHILQTAAWGQLKSGFGWASEFVRVGNCGCQVLFRRLPLGFSFAYVPKGPLGQGWRSLWPEVDRVCRRRRAIFLKVEPDCWDSDLAAIEPDMAGFIPSTPIQPYRSAVVSLQGSEDDWLARMKQKTRYNIHLAQRKGVVVRPGSAVRSFHELMTVTGRRDGFGVHSLKYYQRAYDLFAMESHCNLLEADFEGKLLAALMVFTWGQRAWYFYGASSDEERNRMPTYLLQWEAMRWAASQGCLEYDLWGVPDVDEAELEQKFAGRSDGLWGVYRFKRGFGGEIRRTAGAWDRVYMPALYRFFRWWTSKRGGEGG